MILYLDFETKDNYLNRDVGTGWVFKYHNQLNSIPDDDFKILGAAYAIDDEPAQYTTDFDLIKKLILQAHRIVMHNAQYDLGCLEVLGVDTKILLGSPVTAENVAFVLDTMLIAKLYDNRLHSYSLDYLGKKYLKITKDNQALCDAAEKYGLVSHLKKENKTYQRELNKYVKSNMELLQQVDFKSVAKYAKQDIELTRELSKLLLNTIDIKQARYFSRFAVICVDIRKRGIGIDMVKLKELISDLSTAINKTKAELTEKLGNGINLNSSQQLAKVLGTLGYALPKTETGADGVNKELFNKYPNDSLINTLKAYREYNKLYNDFLLKTLNTQSYTCPEALHGGSIGRVYPELNILAAVTGRFSSSNPNIQQIPKRSADWGNKIRSIFIPTDGSKWISADYNNQEGRLQIHYARKVGAPYLDELIYGFKENPSLDMHKKAAALLFSVKEEDVTKEQRTIAKSINLGISYGMGVNKLSVVLNLNIDDAQILLDLYKRNVPYLSYLNSRAIMKIKTGYITTIAGRKLQRDNILFNEDGEKIHFDYKALNKLIQGSAADQCLAAMSEAFDKGINILSVVHDEINAQGTQEDADKLKEIMESVIKLEIPVLAEVSIKTSWGE